MSNKAIEVKGISKMYRLGLFGTGSLKDDLTKLWAKLRGKEDPFLKLGVVNDRSKASTDDYVWALKDINFSVQKGEIIGIIGKNGAGKSTLLKILSNIAPPTTGSIKMNGRVASLLEVGTGFHPELTGRENIFLNGAILGMSKAEIASKLDEIIEFSGVAKYVDTPVKRYSSGMKVRLGFAVAAHLEPEILIVDEVLAVGDAEFQKKAIGKMQDVSSGGQRTVLFVSHNMISIKSLCDRAIVIDNGCVAYDGNVDVAIEKYLYDDLNASKLPQFDFNVNGQLSEITLKSIGIENLLGEKNYLIQYSEPFRVKIGYENRSKEHLDFTLKVKYQDEILLTTSSAMATNDFEWRTSGSIYCSIPGSFLNQGVYSLDLLVIADKRHLVKKYQDVIQFEVDYPKREIGDSMVREKSFIVSKFNWGAA